ncbi:MAG TPA: hypothetical protein PLB89_15780 [Flavobacteriales bacterium]|nr:hypothetical protein [Flavobacteriales bacterium]
MRNASLIPLLLLVTAGHAQVIIDRSVILTGSTDTQRQVIGLEAPQDDTELQTAGTEGPGQYRVAGPVTGNTWTVVLPALNAPQPGTHVVVRAPLALPGGITLLLNSSGPYPVLLADGNALEGTDLAEGLLLSLVFDGSAFRVLNGTADLPRTCATGSVPVNRQFCMETTQRAPKNFFDAALECHADGLRLCRWGEFYAACERATELGLLQMTDGWEWTNNSSNEDNSVRIVGASGQCMSAGNALASGSADRAFRCCSTR